jgi:GntR family transcriptional regulator
MGKEQISESNKSPMYLQLREILRSKIDDGEFIPGSAIPSENELAQTYGLHRLTVRNAITALENEGLLKPIQGKGVFVIGEKIGRDLEKLTGFRQTMREHGVTPETHVIITKQRSAGIKYAQILEISPEDQIFYIRRLCLADEEPVSIEDIFIPSQLLSDLESVDLNVFSLFDIYEFKGIHVTKAWQTLTTTNLDAKDARILQIKPETRVLLFECVSRNENGKVIEFSRSYTRSDKASFTVHYTRNKTE